MFQFRRRYPETRLVISYTGGVEIPSLVLEQEVDVTLTLEPGPEEPVSRMQPMDWIRNASAARC